MLAALIAVAAAAILGAAVSLQRDPDAASAAGSGPRMTLTVQSIYGLCTSATCQIGLNTPFTLRVRVAQGPAGGYILMQTYLDYGIYNPAASEDGAGPNTCSDTIDNGGTGGIDRFDTDCATVALAYTKTPSVATEIVWPNCSSGTALRSQPGPGLVNHGCVTSLTSPPKSNHIGNVVALAMRCSAGASDTTIALLPYNNPIAGTFGAAFSEFGTNNVITPKVDTLTVKCLNIPTPTPTPTRTPTPTPSPTPPKQAEPGDSDGDGCSDQRENGPNVMTGGLRHYLNPWDFYDVLGPGGGPKDRQIDLANDILGVIQHYAPTGPVAPYNANFDRGASAGPNAWNMTQPDGRIDLANDILGVILQYTHDCR